MNATVKIIVVSVVLLLVAGCTSAQTPEKLLFVRNDMGVSIATNELQIFVLDLKSDKYTKIADGSGPSISPDGKLIAFDSYGTDTENQNHDIWVIDADGRGERNITKSKIEYEIAPVWLPDGKTIQYLKGPDTSDICFIQIDGTNNRCLKWFLWSGVMVFPIEISWIPTGDPHIQTAVFSAWLHDEPEHKIFVLTLHDGELSNLQHLADADFFYLSPGGKKVLFSRYDDPNFYMINPDGSKLVRITNFTEGCWNPSAEWSKDGRKILFYQKCSAGDATQSGLKVMSADGSEITVVVDKSKLNGDIYSFKWTPDEKDIIYSLASTDASLQANIYRYNVETGVITQLTEPDRDTVDYIVGIFP